MKFTSALSTLLVLLPAVTNAIAIPAPVDNTGVQRRDGTVVARQVQGRIVARQNRNGRNRNGQNRNGQNNNNGQNNQNNQNNGQNNQNNGQNNQNNGQNNQNNGQNNQNNGQNNQNNGQNNQNNGQNNQNNGQNNGQDNGQNNQNNGQNNNEDPQESLTLLAELVAPGLAQDGQDPPVAGQVASLTTQNNFINFCAGQTITNGEQVTGGSCNPVPMGDIIPQANMPSSKFTNPPNFGTIQANQAFTASIAVQNMDTGHFVNAQKNYFAAPQQLTPQGILLAHSHIVIQEMGDFANPEPLDPLQFAFFKGLNDAAVGNVLSAEVTNGLAPGNYRMASIHSSANHAPAIAAVAQHGFFDDIVYFTVA